jgi:membrane-bound ClpP family serine protease
MNISPWLITLIVILIVAFIVFAVIWVVRAHRRQVAAGKEELIGKTALAMTEMNPLGTVLVEGEYWTAVSASGRVEPQEEVTITRVDGLKLTVTRKS